MNIYMTFIIIFALIFVGALLVFIYLKNDEKNLKEVDDAKLSRMGKKYSKIEYESTMSDFYFEILTSIENEDYNNLRDIVSDQEYNKILAEKKDEKEKNLVSKVTNINKSLVKLIDIRIVNDLEIAKLLIEYSSIDYTMGNREVTNEKGEKEIQSVVVSGDDSKPVYHKYILTFVRNRTNTEEIKCPTCGFANNLLLKAKCAGCDTPVVPKTMHWVYAGKVNTNLGK